jgi:hypothetical protein
LVGEGRFVSQEFGRILFAASVSCYAKAFDSHNGERFFAKK